MIAFAYSASESSDLQMIFFTAFRLSDTESGITVFQLTATVRTPWYIFTALNKKHLVLEPVASLRISVYSAIMNMVFTGSQSTQLSGRGALGFFLSVD